MTGAEAGQRVPLARYATVALSVPTMLLVTGHIAVGVYHRYVDQAPAAVRLMDLGGDASLPSMWNVTLLLACAAAAVAVAVLSRSGDTPRSRSWLAVAVVFTYLAVDEGMGLHEQLGGPGREIADTLGVQLSTYAWLLPGAVLTLAGLGVFAWWVRALPADVRARFIGAALLYLGGALLVEALNGYLRSRRASLLHLIGTTVEESLEMAGGVLAATAMLRLIRLDAMTRTAGLRRGAPP